MIIILRYDLSASVMISHVLYDVHLYTYGTVPVQGFVDLSLYTYRVLQTYHIGLGWLGLGLGSDLSYRVLSFESTDGPELNIEFFQYGRYRYRTGTVHLHYIAGRDTPVRQIMIQWIIHQPILELLKIGIHSFINSYMYDCRHMTAFSSL